MMLLLNYAFNRVIINIKSAPGTAGHSRSSPRGEQSTTTTTTTSKQWEASPVLGYERESCPRRQAKAY